MKVAFFAYPVPYGLYTIFRNLRPVLGRQGIELRWVSVHPQAAVAAADPLWAGEVPYGEAVPADGPAGPDNRPAGTALVRHIESAGYDAVIVNAPQYNEEMNVVRYLDPRIIRLLEVQTTALGAYPPLRGLRGHVHAAVGASPRTHDDLVHRSGFPAADTSCIANGIVPDPFTTGQRTYEKTLRLLFSGRHEETQKGIFWLPRLMHLLSDLDVHLTIAGDGADSAELRRRCHGLEGRVTFVGRIAPADIPALLNRHDVFLMTSRSEGLPMALLEAMAAGCVPVVSRLVGVTDFVVQDSINGRLYPVGDMAAAAAAIRQLAVDRTRVPAFAAAARDTILQRFTADTMGAGYADLLKRLAANPPKILAPLPLSEWAYPRSFRSGLLRRLLPRKVKTKIQSWVASSARHT